jgi:hypothetical protein
LELIGFQTQITQHEATQAEPQNMIVVSCTEGDCECFHFCYAGVFVLWDVITATPHVMLLVVWVIRIFFVNVHFITTLTNIFAYAKIIYKSQMFPGLWRWFIRYLELEE